MEELAGEAPMLAELGMTDQDVTSPISNSESEDDAEDRRAFGIWQALPVPQREPDWDREEADSVEEYLCRVRWEAQQLPSTVISDVNPREFDEACTRNGTSEAPQEPLACDPALLPRREWATAFLASFERLREDIQREVDAADDSLGMGVSFAVNLPKGDDPALPHGEGCGAASAEPTGPSVFSCMPELEALRTLRSATVAQTIGSRVARLVRSGVTPEATAELFALSARVELPLLPNTCAAYRRLLVHCADRRAHIGAEGAMDECLPHLNILTAIASGIFGQGPLELRD